MTSLSAGSNSLAAGNLHATADLALGLETAVGVHGDGDGAGQRVGLLGQVRGAGLDPVDEAEGDGLGGVSSRIGNVDTQFGSYQARRRRKGEH
jgi:hypothetical protein